MRSNFLIFFRSKKSLAIALIIAVWVMSIFINISDYPTIRGNQGPIRLSIEIVVQILLSLSIGLYCWVNYFRHRYFHIQKEGTKRNLLATVGGISGALVIGCPACGFTLAWLFWLATALSFLPFGGEELKYIWLIMIIIANISLFKDLRTCPVRKS